MDKKERIAELVRILDEAARVYEQEDREVMSNFEYDALYDELRRLEEETGIVLSNSPTQHAGYEILSELPKERHESPMLSLDKTKDREALAAWTGERDSILSWKLDGLTVVLTYRDGELYKAVTRGNGEIGEVITNNARVFKNIPLKIAYKGELVLRGEAVIRYSDFEKINAAIPKDEDRYKNPRNLCSGTVRQLNNRITAERNVYLFPFALISMDGEDGFSTRTEQLSYLKELGFEPVDYKVVNRETMAETIQWFADTISANDFPSDGLVLTYNDIAYGRSLGRTAKFPRNAIAFKWKDETRATRLLSIEWSPSRTGLINPVAIFEPVELEGTTVSRASVHNLSIMEELQLGIGDEITVYKANMIIPQIADNLTRSGNMPIPETCPVCGGRTEVRALNEAKELYCGNPKCLAKKIKLFSHFASRDAMNIEGLSEMTIEKLIAKGFVKEPADFFRMDTPEIRAEFTSMEGFGEKSFLNLLAAAKKASLVSMPKFLYSLGIPGIGLANAKLICRHFSYDMQAIRSAAREELLSIDGLGEVLAGSFTEYMADAENDRQLSDLLSVVSFEAAAAAQESPISGKTFVITGSVMHFPNRDAVKSYIEERGGKVAGSVSAKTDYLINNDRESGSSKNKKAKELGIPILSEEDFLALCEGKEE
ncbi:MAG: NAD-dependent DNA ligase LigA [Lachnospiraceae bacterium]|nr:NAD-dependent DNA ligase LigA [Lachnospiraceae bacterium]